MTDTNAGARTHRSRRAAGRSLLPAVLALSVATTSCGGDGGGGTGSPAGEAAAGIPTRGGAAVICAQGQPESLNALLSPDQFALDLSPLVYTPLVRIGPDLELEGRLATDWSWEDDQRRLVLHIRPDLQWHDGAPVSAEDVAWTFRTAADTAFGSYLAPDLATLGSAQAMDPVTVEVRFREPFRPGLVPFAGMPVLPKHILGDLAPEAFQQAPYNREPIGNGPYRVASRSGDGGLLFERAPDYPADLGGVYLDRILFRAIPEEATMAGELRSGGVDLCVTSSSTASLEGIRGLKIEPLAPPAEFVLALNMAEPPLNDARVRRALSAALARSDVAAVFSPLASPAVNPLTPDSPWIDDAVGEPDADPGLADSLLAAAGWTRDGDGIRTDAAGDPLRVTVYSPSLYDGPLTAIQALWRQAGVQTELRFMEWASYVRVLMDPGARPDAMALRFNEDRLLRPDFTGTYFSQSPLNISSYQSEDADRIIEALDAAGDSAELRTLYRDLQHRLTADVPVLYVAYAPRALAVGSRLRGVEPAPSSPLASVANWWIPSDRRR